MKFWNLLISVFGATPPAPPPLRRIDNDSLQIEEITNGLVAKSDLTDLPIIEPPPRDLVFHHERDENEGLKGPWSMDIEQIESMHELKFPGCYALGLSDIDGGLVVKMIERSDMDLASDIVLHAGEFSHFMAIRKESSESAFHSQCRLYHRFGKLISMGHPMREFNRGWTCPKCGIFNPGV